MINVRSDKAIFLISDEVIAVRGIYDPTTEKSKTRPAGSDAFDHTAQWNESQYRGELFKTLMADITVGDIVVVESASRTGFSTIKVTEVNADFDYDSDESCRWIVQKIDHDAHKDLRTREHAAVGQVKNAQRDTQRAELRKAMLGGADADEAMDAIATGFTAIAKE